MFQFGVGKPQNEGKDDKQKETAAPSAGPGHSPKHVDQVSPGHSEGIHHLDIHHHPHFCRNEQANSLDRPEAENSPSPRLPHTWD
jgi:hypothetical protein